METFGTHLLQFANSVDHVSIGVLNQVHTLISAYLKNCLKIHFYEFLVPVQLNDKAGLTTSWQEGGKQWTRSIRKDDGSYHGQISYAWDTRRSIWVIDKDQGLLKKSKNYVNLWDESVSDQLPEYVDLAHNHVKTSIIMVIDYNGEALSILNLESTFHLKVTEILQNELRCIATSLGIIYGHHRTYKIQKSTTDTAVSNLQEFAKIPLPYNPQIFISSSDRADEDVINAIAEVVRKFNVKDVFWKLEKRPGNIPNQIWDNIYSSQAAICYISEPAEIPGEQPKSHRAKKEYLDNPNVIFEVGMIQALIKIPHSIMKQCILVREGNSAKAPFNFAGERMIVIERKNEKHVLEKFKERLEETLNEILKNAEVNA